MCSRTHSPTAWEEFLRTRSPVHRPFRGYLDRPSETAVGVPCMWYRGQQKNYSGRSRSVPAALVDSLYKGAGKYSWLQALLSQVGMALQGRRGPCCTFVGNHTNYTPIISSEDIVPLAEPKQRILKAQDQDKRDSKNHGFCRILRLIWSLGPPISKEPPWDGSRDDTMTRKSRLSELSAVEGRIGREHAWHSTGAADSVAPTLAHWLSLFLSLSLSLPSCTSLLRFLCARDILT